MSNEVNIRDDNAPLFTSIGLFILDEIEWNDGKQKVDNIIGGAGTFAGLGCRLFLQPPDQSKRSCFIVDMGNDFPDNVKEELDTWQAGIVFRSTPERKTTRGWNRYGKDEVRDFGYSTPKKRIEVDDLLENKHLLKSKSFHLICSPNRCIDIATKLRKAGNKDGLIVWEPVPPECKPENLDICIETLRDYVDIFSPNVSEAAAFFGEEAPTTNQEIELLASRFLSIIPDKVVVIRCGDKGCFVATSEQQRMFPAYHNQQFDDYCVKDPTGGGNAFLGGFTAGYLLHNGDTTKAAVYGNVAAGIVLEQVGMPKVTTLDNGQEAWNDTRIQDRVDTYIMRYDAF